MADFNVVNDIVMCPSCGSRNRIGTYATNLSPVCGKCGASLENLPGFTSSNDPKPRLNNQYKRDESADFNRLNVIVASIALGVGGVAILIVFTWILMRPEKPLPSSYVSDQGLKQISSVPQTTVPNTSSAQQAFAPVANSGSAQPQSPVSFGSQPAPSLAPQLAAPIQNRKFENGTLFRTSTLNGNGELTVINGLRTDATAKLIDRRDNTCIAHFGISATDTFKLTNLPDGDYKLLFAVGEDWDFDSKRFTCKRRASEFDKPLDFNTSTRSVGAAGYEVEYKVHEITLNPVPDGNVTTHDISESEFDKY